ESDTRCPTAACTAPWCIGRSASSRCRAGLWRPRAPLPRRCRWSWRTGRRLGRSPSRPIGTRSRRELASRRSCPSRLGSRRWAAGNRSAGCRCYGLRRGSRSVVRPGVELRWGRSPSQRSRRGRGLRLRWRPAGSCGAYELLYDNSTWLRDTAIALVPGPGGFSIHRDVVGQPGDSCPVGVHDVDVVRAIPVALEGQLLTGGRPGGFRVVGVVVKPRDPGPVVVHQVNVDRPVAVALPRYLMAAPGGREVADGALGARELGDFAPVRVHDVDLVVAVAVAGERDLLAVARPRRIKMPDGGRSVGEGGDSAPVRVHDVDLVVAVAVAHERDRAFGVVAGRRT